MPNYILKIQIPTIEQYKFLRSQAGLSRKSIEAASIGLPKSLFAVLVFDDEQIIGMGRIVGDGGCFFQIVDMAVVPSHQGKGVGAMVMRALINYLDEHAPKTAFISLMSDNSTPEFYKKFGFKISHPPRKAGMYKRFK